MENRTIGAVDNSRLSRAEETRARILSVAYESVIQKGFGATSIEELITETGVSKSGFFYHFRDKTELAKALLTRYLAEDEQFYDRLFARARELVDDPLQIFLLFLRLFAEEVADMPNGHPGCLVAISCYGERQFSRDVREINMQAALEWRRRFGAVFDEIAARYPPRIEMDGDDFADLVSTVFEGGIVISKAMDDPNILPRQILAFRSMVKLMFTPEPAPVATTMPSAA